MRLMATGEVAAAETNAERRRGPSRCSRNHKSKQCAQVMLASFEIVQWIQAAPAILPYRYPCLRVSVSSVNPSHASCLERTYAVSTIRTARAIPITRLNTECELSSKTKHRSPACYNLPPPIKQHPIPVTPTHPPHSFFQAGPSSPPNLARTTKPASCPAPACFQPTQCLSLFTQTRQLYSPSPSPSTFSVPLPLIRCAMHFFSDCASFPKNRCIVSFTSSITSGGMRLPAISDPPSMK